MAKGLQKFSLVCVLFSLTSGVMAAASAPYGWYGEINLGRSDSSKSYPGKSLTRGFGYNLNGGYKFTQYFAGEVGFTRYGQARVQTATGSTVAFDQHYSYDLTAKVILPVGTTGAELFGKAGIARIHSDLTVNNPSLAASNGMAFNPGIHTANAYYLGLGAAYAITPNILANLQWARASGSHNTGRVELYSAGLSYIL